MTGSAPTRRRGFRTQITELSDRWQRLLAQKTTTFYLILIPVTALTGFGLLMVLSASSVTSGDASVSSAFSVFLRQAIYAASAAESQNGASAEGATADADSDVVDAEVVDEPNSGDTK